MSGALLDAIPGNKFVYLKAVEEECHVKLHTLGEDSFSFRCTTEQIVPLHERLSSLLTPLENPFNQKEMRHKGVNCDLLRPMFSRSGREVKPKHFDSPVDDEPANISREEPRKTQSGFKRKRGRPPKYAKQTQDMSTNSSCETTPGDSSRNNAGNYSGPSESPEDVFLGTCNETGSETNLTTIGSIHENSSTALCEPQGNASDDVSGAKVFLQADQKNETVTAQILSE